MVHVRKESRSRAALPHLATLFVAVSVGMLLPAGIRSADAQTQTAKISVAYSLTGAGASIGSPELDGIRLAIDEANAAGIGPTIELSVNDDRSDPVEGRKLAQQIGAGDALVALAPATTLMAMETGPIYAKAGIVAIGGSTTGDDVTVPPTFFRAIASTSDGGEMLASYVRYILGGSSAIGSTRTIATGAPLRRGLNELRNGSTSLPTTAHSRLLPSQNKWRAKPQPSPGARRSFSLRMTGTA